MSQLLAVAVHHVKHHKMLLKQIRTRAAVSDEERVSRVGVDG